MHTFVVLAYKESQELETCIKSVLNQSLKTNVVIATSTPNTYIKKMAKKYSLQMIINKEQKGIGYDFDFASNCVESELVTISHQDDIYDANYAEKVVEAYQKNKNALIIFTDYYEIKNEQKEKTNKNLKIKRVLLFPLRFRFLSKFKFFKRFVLRFGNAISCPAVTFVRKNVPKDKFKCHFKCDVDWYAWEKLSHLNGSFIYIKDKLMGHRIHEDSTTTEIIKENIRTQEDLEMFQKFWPKWIAKSLNSIYKNSEKNNEEK
ncbi:MAG: glycosyltransferase [Bacilli bacterium]|nr:glycosyltransferase [Bacilli bacterium]